MPVKGLTERPNIPRLGKIRLGDRGGTNGAPRNMPHFVVPPEVAEVYGESPTELKVVFLSDDLERIASQWYRAYNASSGLICKGDGERANALLDADVLKKNGGELTINSWAHGATRGANVPATTNFVRQEISCLGAGYDGEPACPMFATKKCAVRNFMQFAIRDVPGLGVYQMDTGSLISTRNINGAIELARMMFGGVARVPMVLRRVKQDVAPDGTKKGVWMVELQVDTQYSLANLIELHKDPTPTALLPPVDESEPYDAIGDEDDAPAALPAPAEDQKRPAPTRRQIEEAAKAQQPTWQQLEEQAKAQAAEMMRIVEGEVVKADTTPERAQPAPTTANAPETPPAPPQPAETGITKDTQNAIARVMADVGGSRSAEDYLVVYKDLMAKFPEAVVANRLTGIKTMSEDRALEMLSRLRVWQAGEDPNREHLLVGEPDAALPPEPEEGVWEEAPQ